MSSCQVFKMYYCWSYTLVSLFIVVVKCYVDTRFQRSTDLNLINLFNRQISLIVNTNNRLVLADHSKHCFEWSLDWGISLLMCVMFLFSSSDMDCKPGNHTNKKLIQGILCWYIFYNSKSVCVDLTWRVILLLSLLSNAKTLLNPLKSLFKIQTLLLPIIRLLGELFSL